MVRGAHKVLHRLMGDLPMYSTTTSLVGNLPNNSPSQKDTRLLLAPVLDLPTLTIRPSVNKKSIVENKYLLKQ
jgi:hypothetical protein